jgi:hypothetical protein
VEGFSHSEQYARRAWLTQNLAEKGEMDPEVQEILKSWTTSEEMLRQEAGEPNYLLTMELARVFEEAGLSSNCDYYLDLVYQDAFHAGDEATCQKIRDIFSQS